MVNQEKHLPNLIIIGAMKSGTTSLHHYLNLHPEIQMTQQKELNFFSKDKNWNRGIDWYKSHFVGKAKIYGESSPNYTRYPQKKGIPERIFSVIPQTKLIYILRNPIERIISHYVHNYASGEENCSFEEAINKIECNDYLERSQYFLQLEQYLEYFPKSNILIITSEEMSKNAQKTMKKVFQFLEVDSDFEFTFKINNITDISVFGFDIINSSFKFDKKLHTSLSKRRRKIAPNSPIVKTISATMALLPIKIRPQLEKIIYRLFSEKVERPEINDELQQKIMEYLAEDIAKLQKYTNYSFEEWSLNVLRTKSN